MGEQRRRKTTKDAKRQNNNNKNEESFPLRKLLLLHGSRQVGEILLGRMDKLKKKLKKLYNVEIIAPDGPFPHSEDSEMRQWWERKGNAYIGIEETFALIQSIWNNNPELKGIIGFSQGARLAHLLVQCHESSDSSLQLNGLRYVIMCAGYDAPIPSNLEINNSTKQLLCTPSLHVYGTRDKLIPPKQSKDVIRYYQNTITHEHDGGHHVPMKANNIQVYLDFIDSNSKEKDEAENNGTTTKATNNTTENNDDVPNIPQDEETMMAQQDEVEALSAIFPEEFHLLTNKNDDTDEYEFPIMYQIDLPVSEEEEEGIWPPHPISLQISYPYNYPTDSIPTIKLIHNNNMMEFNLKQIQACEKKITDAAKAEFGMPTVMSCVYAARDFFESGAMSNLISEHYTTKEEEVIKKEGDTNFLGEGDEGNLLSSNASDNNNDNNITASSILPASKERIKQCNLEGLEIARLVLMKEQQESSSPSETKKYVTNSNKSSGGVWNFTCGLVGKPSVGKSTFFNAATAFARQRDDADNAIGGATMAPHPFTTIDPNIGFCLVPAPSGSCPEEGINDNDIGCTHGRDHLGRRLLPVMLKDVAGLVPGAYQGRGRGNKFLNDLTDADVLIHVVDASGMADTEGNVVGREEGSSSSNPIDDLAWILNELIEWVFNNIVYKWDRIKRKGHTKLIDMFSGYGQSQSFLHRIVDAVEDFMESNNNNEQHTTVASFEELHNWDKGDLHRLVSAFLGVRFPMALALNKKDLASAKEFIKNVQEELPLYGAHVGIPVSAKSEMNFVLKYHQFNIENKDNDGEDSDDNCNIEGKSVIKYPSTFPEGVWQCLQSAITLREPILIFPVHDMTTYAPLPAMSRIAAEDPSLPNAGMIRCIQAAGGNAPTLWDTYDNNYIFNSKSITTTIKLRDVLLMKIGSTVEDVFLALKRMGVLGGEFVRAEGAGDIGEKPKLIPKHELLNRSNRILKIMTNNKRREWQKNL